MWGEKKEIFSVKLPLWSKLHSLRVSLLLYFFSPFNMEERKGSFYLYLSMPLTSSLQPLSSLRDNVGRALNNNEYTKLNFEGMY